MSAFSKSTAEGLAPRKAPATSDPPQRIAVVGGGIAGLAAAHRLVERSPFCRVVLFESRSRLGGVISTLHQDGFQIEQSADNFITTVPWGLDLCRRLGLADQLIQTDPNLRQAFVVRRGRLYKLPEGFLMLAPTRLWPLAITPLLSPWGKLRAALEYVIPPRREQSDESMAAFARRRLGRETFERLVEPLVSAVYAANMERLSVDATLPRFRDMEREHGSLIRAMRREMARCRKAGQNAERESGARYSLFVTLRDGLSSLVDAVAARLPADSIRLDTTVSRLERRGNRAWALSTGAGHAEPFDAVILATPSHVTAELLQPVDAHLAGLLGSIEHSGTAILSVAYRRDQVAHPLDGAGAVVPAIERSPILAVSFSSRKYAHRAPEGTVLLRVFVGGARAPEMAEMEDDRLRPLILDNLAPLLGIRGEPLYCQIAHWPRTMPQYHVGHRELVAQIDARVAELPGLQLAGNAYRGVGIPDCIHTGQTAAERSLSAPPQGES